MPEPTAEPRFNHSTLSLLEEIEANGSDLGRIIKNLKFNNPQALNNHLVRLRKLNLIERQQSFPHAVYNLTPLGIRLKQTLVESQPVSSLWRCHAKIIGFEISDWGAWKWTLSKRKQMNNWFFEQERIKDSQGEWSVHIQSTGLLKIYCPEVYSDDKKSAFARMDATAAALAQKLAEGYKMRLGQLRVIREGHAEMVHSERLAALLGHTKIGNVWVDISEKLGKPKVEEYESEDALETVLAIPKALGSLEKHMAAQTEIMDRFAEQLSLHLSVLSEMRDTLRAMREEMRK